MKWKIKKEYKLGDRRFVNRFSIFPVKLDSGIIIWLEKYTEIYQKQQARTGGKYHDYEWKRIRTYQEEK